MIPRLINKFTRRLGPPEGRTLDECSSLGIRDVSGELGNEMWSAWEPTPEELKALHQGGLVYLKICGLHHPMVWIAAAMSFEGDEHEAEHRLMDLDISREGPFASAKLLEIAAELNVMAPEIASALDVASQIIDRQHQLIEALQQRQIANDAD